MNRGDLLKKLNTVAPALASSGIVPVLQHFWFTGTRLIAYNQSIAISVPCKTEFEGALPRTLLTLLNASVGKEVTFIPKEGGMGVRTIYSKSTIPMLPSTQFLTEIKNAMDNPKSAGFDFTEQEQLKACFKSVGDNKKAYDECKGITIRNGFMYASDNVTITRVKLKTKINHSVILAPEFCRQLAELPGTVKLEVTAESALAIAGDTALRGSVIAQVSKPLDFEGLFGSLLPKNYGKAVYKIPQFMPSAIDRAIIITDTDKSTTTITVKDGVGTCKSQSGTGIEVGTFNQKKKLPQGDVTVTIDSRKIKDGLNEGYTHMLVAEKCMIMTKGDANLYMLSAAG